MIVHDHKAEVQDFIKAGANLDSTEGFGNKQTFGYRAQGKKGQTGN